VSRHIVSPWYLFAAVLAAALLAGLSLRPPGAAQAGFDSIFDICGESVTVNMTMTAGFEHEEAIGMPAQKDLVVQCPVGRAAQPAGFFPVIVNSGAPWIVVSGPLTLAGEFDGQGNGTIANTADVDAMMDAMVALNGDVSGDYTLSGLSANDAVYHFEGNFLAGAPTPSPTPSPTQAPGQDVVWGNLNDCSGEPDPPDPVDSLLVLRSDAGLNTNTGDCPGVGTEVDVLNASLHLWGDVDCSSAVNPVDSLKLLRFDAGLSVSQEEGCPLIGGDVQIVMEFF
jgi:hypothetical protein